MAKGALMKKLDLRKNIGMLWLIVGLVLIGFSLPKTSFDAVAQVYNPIARITPTAIDSAHFKTGSFKQTTTGAWDELDAKGNIRFSFDEVMRDETSVFLINHQHNVSIEINDPDRIIYASWPGQARHIMHRITSASIAPPTPPEPPIVTAPPYTIEPPIPAEPPIVTAPPLTVKPPIAIAPPGSSVQTELLTTIIYEGGEFQKSGQYWTDVKQSGERTTYRQLGYDRKHIYLVDEADNHFVILDVKSKAIRNSNGQKISKFGKITGLAAVSVPPVIEPEGPQFNRPLPATDRLACIASGGIVERAGMLGHERCTKSYSDANMSCTDSNQCQGRCLSETGENEQTGVIGKCQATDNPFGCFTEVKNGRTEFGLCVD